MNDLPGMWYEINHNMFMIDPTWCDMYTTNCQACDTKSSRNSVRCRKHERTSTYTALRDFSAYFLKTKKLYRMCTKNDLNWMICHVCDTKSTTLCSWLIPHDVICMPRTARYVIRNQAETAEDAESTSEHLRIQQYAIFRFIFSRRKTCTVWYALKMI